MSSISRREMMALTLATSTSALGTISGCDVATPIPKPSNTANDSVAETRSNQLVHLAPYVSRLTKWKAGDLFTFCNAMNQTDLASLARGLELPTPSAEDSKPQLLSAIHKEIVWQSSNIVSYSFKSIEEIDYHRIVSWCAQSVGVDSTTTSFTSTFDLEQAIVKKQFSELWDKLTNNQRLELLEKIDTGHTIQDRAAVAAMSGTAALASLSTTVYFSGFAFYTTMSVVISTVAGWFSITLPFVAYTTASSTVAVLAGPIGWAIGAVLFAAAVAWTGRANVKKTTALVMQLHALKAGALYCNSEM